MASGALKKMGVWLGLVDDDEYDDYAPYEEPSAPMRRNGGQVAVAEPEVSVAGVRTLPATTRSVQQVSRRSCAPSARAEREGAHRRAGGFNDAQEIVTS